MVIMPRCEQVRGILHPPRAQQDLRHEQYGVGMRCPEEQRMAHESGRLLDLPLQQGDSTELEPRLGALVLAADFRSKVGESRVVAAVRRRPRADIRPVSGENGGSANTGLAGGIEQAAPPGRVVRSMTGD